MASNQLRIIGGACRRRVVRFPDGEGLRPTPDRVRETLFNWLGQSLDGLSCLDLFAGSGALGLESASRGAARVVMVERQAAVVQCLKQNVQLLNLRGVEILRADALEFASRFRGGGVASPLSPNAGQAFDVVFLDPPYHQGWLEKLAPQLEGLVVRRGRLYVEAEQALDAFPGHPDWVTYKSGRAGQVYYHLMHNVRNESDSYGQTE